MAGHWFNENSAGIGIFVRIAFGMVWLINGSLKFQAGEADAFVQTMQGIAAGQPGWLAPWFGFWSGLIAQNPSLFVNMIGTCEMLIGLALVFGFMKKLMYILGALYSFVIWAVPEGFGGPYGPGSTDVGTGIVYVFVFIALMVISANRSSRLSLDDWLEKRLGWWAKLAEFSK